MMNDDFDVAAAFQPAFERAPSLLADPAALEHALMQFVVQYLQALTRATTPEAWQRAWDAFGRYLTAAATRRKAFHLTQDEADAVVAGLQETLARLVDEDNASR